MPRYRKNKRVSPWLTATQVVMLGGILVALVLFRQNMGETASAFIGAFGPSDDLRTHQLDAGSGKEEAQSTATEEHSVGLKITRRDMGKEDIEDVGMPDMAQTD